MVLVYWSVSLSAVTPSVVLVYWSVSLSAVTLSVVLVYWSVSLSAVTPLCVALFTCLFQTVTFHGVDVPRTML